jgi:hypothetical protein
MALFREREGESGALLLGHRGDPSRDGATSSKRGLPRFARPEQHFETRPTTQKKEGV